MSVFEIDGKIDCGKLLANRVVEIQQMDDSKTLKHKLEQTIPSLLSDIALDNNRIEKFYCKKVDEKDYKVELGSCSIEDIERIIKSQKMYNGAMINQQCITDINVKDYEWTKKEETETEISYEVKAKVVLKKKGFFENLEVWHKIRIQVGRKEKLIMNVCVVKTGNELEQLCDQIQLYPEYNIDSIASFSTDVFWGENAISYFEMKKRYEKNQIDKIIIQGAYLKVEQRIHLYEKLVELGIEKEDILFERIEIYDHKVDCPFAFIDDLCYLDYLEFHTNDHCNLKCNNCNNFSNLIKGEVWADYDLFVKDLNRMKELVRHINVIRVLGGEPLLNEDTYKFLLKTREVYPYSQIRLVTNGILIPNMSEKLISSIKECNVIVEITAYPPMFSCLDERINWLKEKGIQCELGWLATSFHKPIIERYSFNRTKLDCMACVNLREGRLAMCPMIQYIHIYNEANGTHFDEKEGILNIYEENMNYKELYHRLMRPVDLCNYCGCYRDDLQKETWHKSMERN
jgi:hypothetical protein